MLACLCNKTNCCIDNAFYLGPQDVLHVLPYHAVASKKKKRKKKDLQETVSSLQKKPNLEVLVYFSSFM